MGGLGGPCLGLCFLFDIMYKYKVGEAVTVKDLINNVNWREYLMGATGEKCLRGKYEDWRSDCSQADLYQREEERSYQMKLCHR